MKPQEIELWSRDIVDSVLKGKPAEDSRVELKAYWLEPDKAAHRLGGQANAARGENILWLIGINERNKSLTNIDETEKGDWFRSVEKLFDGFAPRLLVDVNFKVNGNSLVALYFETATEAPFVIKNSKGGYPEYIVPWREGTALRAASRENLLRILVPTQKLSGLKGELEFNLLVVQKAEEGSTSNNYSRYISCPFETKQYDLAMESGVISTLEEEIRGCLFEAYWGIKSANQRIIEARNPKDYSQNIETLNMIASCSNKIRKAIIKLSILAKN
jgi:hypothetical protein